MAGEKYELWIKADENGATAEIVKRQKGTTTVVGSVSTSSRTPLPILRFQPIGTQPFSFTAFEQGRKKSLVARLKPSKFSVNLGIIASEWDLSHPKVLDQEELESDKREAKRSEHRQKLLQFYLDEFRKNPVRRYTNAGTNRHATFLKDFRYKSQMLQHLESGYPARAPELSLHETYTRWEEVEKKLGKEEDDLQKALLEGVKTIGEAHNVRAHQQVFAGQSEFYYEDTIINSIRAKADLPEWRDFTLRKLENEDIYYMDSVDFSPVALLKSQNKPDGFTSELNSLVAAHRNGIATVRADLSERARLDDRFQTGFERVLDDAELGYLKGSCDDCP